jgi:uncharacterized protein YkwD
MIVDGSRAMRDDTTVTLESGTSGTVRSAPTQSGGKTWYEVEVLVGQNEKLFWVRESALVGTGDSGTTRTPPPPAFSTGDRVEVASVATAWKTNEKIPSGVTGNVIGGPQSYDAENWYQVHTNRGTYWIVERALKPIARSFTTTASVGNADSFGSGSGSQFGPSGSAGLDAGASVTVPSGTTVWHGRSKTTLSTRLHGTIKQGPTEYKGGQWYKIQAVDGTYWVPTNAASASQREFTTTEYTGTFETGDIVEITRETKIWENNLGKQVDPGIRGEVAEGPTEYEGEPWYVLQTPEREFYVRGAVLEDYDPQFRVGESAMTRNASTAYSDGERTTLDGGTSGQILVGPYESNGWIWYQLRTRKGRFWIAQDYLRGVRGTVDDLQWIDLPLEPGDGVNVTRKTFAWHKGTKLTLPPGFSGTVYGGPTQFNGGAWYHVRSDGLRYWIPAAVLKQTSGGNESIGQGTQDGYNLDSAEALFLGYLNRERTERGLDPLYRREELSKMGRSHSRDMALQQYFAHDDPTGKTLTQRYEERGLMPECRLYTEQGIMSSSYYPGAEAIAWTHVDQRYDIEWAGFEENAIGDEESLAWTLYEMWMHSPAYRELLLSPAADQAGLGLYITDDDRVYASLELC